MIYIGQTVHYRTGSTCFAAIVCAVHDADTDKPSVALAAFNNQGEHLIVQATGYGSASNQWHHAGVACISESDSTQIIVTPACGETSAGSPERCVRTLGHPYMHRDQYGRTWRYAAVV